MANLVRRVAAGSDGWGKGWGDEDDAEDRQASGAVAARGRADSWDEAPAAAPASSRRNDGFAGFDEGEEDGACLILFASIRMLLFV